MPRTFLALFALGLITAVARPQPKPADEVAGYRTLSEVTAAKIAPSSGGPGRVPYLGAAVGRSPEGVVVVEEVQPGSPAAKAGLKAGDLIDKVGEQPVKTAQAFREWLQSYRAGDAVTLGVTSEGKPSALKVTLAAVSRPMKRGDSAAPIGVSLADDDSGKGVVLKTVEKDSPAEAGGLKAGDFVVEIDGQEMSRPSRLSELLADRRAGDVITFNVRRDGKPAEAKVTLAARTTRRPTEPPLWKGPAFRLAVVGVEFAETAHNDKITPLELDRAFFSQDARTGKDATGKDVRGSLADYFREQSAGAFRLEGKAFDWITVPKKRGDYVQGSGTSNKTALMSDALGLLVARDGERALDGFDAIAFVYAGSRYRTNRGAVYYPHAGAVTFKGKTFRYLIGAEGGSTLSPIGTFVKPMGELLGLPDLAARTETIGSEGLGVWCAMSNTFETARPQHLSAWCKERLGWLKPVAVDPTVKQKIVLAPKECLKVLVRPDASEYFLLENRAKKGFDTDLPAEGLLIWRVVDGRPLLEESHGVEGPTGPTSHPSAVPFPSPSNAAFTPLTTPSSLSPQGGGLPVHVTNIRRLSEGRIAFQVGTEFR